VPPKKKARVIDLREVEKKIAQYKEHVAHDRRYKTVVKELEQARLAIRKGFDRLLAAVSAPARPKRAAAKRRPKKQATKKTVRRKSTSRANKRTRPRSSNR
jgi:hypothetical protein